MIKKLSRIFGIIGSAGALLPGLYFAGQNIWTLLQPNDTLHFESKGYASAFLLLAIIYCLIAAPGLAGVFYVGKRPMRAGVLMLLSGLFVFLVSFLLRWFLAIAPLLLIAAGVLALIYNNQKQTTDKVE